MKVKNLVLPLPLARAPFTPSSIGIQLLKTKNTEITNNVADIYLENSSRNVVSGNKGVIKLVESANNRISGNNWWINLFNSSNNVISGNEGGILACHCADVSIVENSLGGIELQNSEGFLISGNNITGNGKGEGILLDFSSYNTICDNIIADHNYGFYLRASSGNTVYGNNIIDNYDQVCSWYSSNVWDDGSKGNYWSDYRGEDANGDGIGDTPYIIAIQGSIPAANDQDNYPLMEPFVIPPPTESFPNIWIIAAAVLMAVVGVALLVYFRKRNH